MCKIVSFTNSSKLDIKKTSEVIGNILLGLERDGFGYAVQGEQNVFGERCISAKFRSRLGSTDLISLPIIEPRQSAFGYLDKPKGPAIFHGRTSTNDKGLLNCHPMAKDNWNLIHNGVVTDHGPKYAKATTNDSEDLLHRLILGINHVERDLSGYYAFCAIDPQGHLHVARDANATLYMAWCAKIQSYLIATTESLLESVADKLKIKIGPIDLIKEDVYLIFADNEMTHSQVIKPRGYDYTESKLASLSLGRSLSDSTYGSDYLDNDYTRFNLDDSTRELDELMDEVEHMDDTYSIQNYDGETITVEQYKKLDEVSKLECLIVRPDGTYLEIGNYRV